MFFLWLIPKSIFNKINISSDVAKIISNSGWLLFDKAIRLLISLLVGTWLARYLGPQQFGDLNYVLTFLAFSQAVALLGLDGLVVRDISRHKELTGEILGTTFILRIVIGILMWCLSILTMGFLNGWTDSSVVIIALAGGILFFQSFDTIDLWFQSKSQSKRTVIVKLFSYIISNFIKILLLVSSAPVEAFAAAITFDACISSIGMIYAYKKYSCRQSLRFVYERAVSLLAESWWFVLAGLINLFQARIEFFLINKYLGGNLLGQYVAALKFIELFDVGGTILAISVFPKISAYIDNKQRDYAISKTYLAMFIIYMISIPFMFFIWYIMPFLYGAEYAVSREIYLFMVLRPLFTYIGVTRSMSIRLDNKSWYSSFCALIGAIVAYCLACFFIPKFGLIGAVLSATVSYFISNIVLDFIFYRKNIVNIIGCIK